jgi:hypothetical protein
MALSDRGPDWRPADGAVDDSLLVIWLVRHPEESLPLSVDIPSGKSFIKGGRIPSVRTPNTDARIAAVEVIRENRWSKGLPFLLSLLDDPTCVVEARAQSLPTVVGDQIQVQNLHRRYLVRDAAATALRSFGYNVAFDGQRYHATPPQEPEQLP